MFEKHVLQVKKIKVYEIVFYRTFIEKIWFMYRKGKKKTLNRKIFLFCFIKHMHVHKSECFLKNVKKNVF